MKKLSGSGWYLTEKLVKEVQLNAIFGFIESSFLVLLKTHFWFSFYSFSWMLLFNWVTITFVLIFRQRNEINNFDASRAWTNRDSTQTLDSNRHAGG